MTLYILYSSTAYVIINCGGNIKGNIDFEEKIKFRIICVTIQKTFKTKARKGKYVMYWQHEHYYMEAKTGDRNKKI